MIKRYSITEARDHFSSVVHEAEKGTTIELTRRGRTVAVLLGVKDERLSRPSPRFWEAYEKFRQEFDLVALGIDPETDLSNLRDPSPGRDFKW
ncbi:MAG TPA: type II toxin-antitoxin system Phd/YefM family antitoxin [Thermoanaerobaculia bacterium]|nr:type II toxin-antitoxin system Phd/YefM family antitoxin [Thermoanaerobaculia bacterium]